MHHQRFVSLLREVLSTPTAPFHEYHVARVIRERLAEYRHVSVETDEFGNLIATYRRGRKRPRLAFAAHMDHPGWVRDNGEPVFLGGVPKERLESHPVDWFGEFGMWQLEPFTLRNGEVHARVCDDLVGCATILALFDELEKNEVEATCYGLFTRAEEVGFIGATRMAKSWPLPSGVRFVSLETSAPRGATEFGKGPVVRVGDRLSVFDDAVTADLIEAAASEKIPVQRALLDGGACEATPMNLFGVPAAGISVLLGNYHNCPPEKGIAEEFVDLSDVKALVRLIYATVRRTASRKPSESGQAALRKRLALRDREHRRYERSARAAWQRFEGEELNGAGKS
ncbi:MAG: M20/M25/M40 family metallo-hydrolase [Verrucomicrobiota bacterium]